VQAATAGRIMLDDVIQALDARIDSNREKIARIERLKVDLLAKYGGKEATCKG